MNFPDSKRKKDYTDLVLVLRNVIETKLWPSLKDVWRRPGWRTKTLNDIFGLILNKEIPIYYWDQTHAVIDDNVELIKNNTNPRQSLSFSRGLFDLRKDKDIITSYYQLAVVCPFIILKLEEVEAFERRHGMHRASEDAGRNRDESSFMARDNYLNKYCFSNPDYSRKVSEQWRFNDK